MPIGGYIKKLAPPGDLPEGLIRWVGPASYTVVTAGSPPTGGDSLPAVLFGVNQILFVTGNGSFTGDFQVIPIRVSSNNYILQWRALRTATIGGQAQTAGLEAVAATNLSGQSVHLHLVTRSA